MSYSLETSIGYQTNLVATILKTSFTKLIQPRFGIAAEQFATLKIINEEQEISQTKIAELLGKDKTTVGRSIESLIKKGLLKREECYIDKRANRVSLTPEAKEILAGANKIAFQYNEGLKQKITEKELEVYFKVLNTILQESKNIELEIERGN
ncbi:MarR family winged helix-turn-helix transcriptional regulator [Sulfurimonas marina]|uniref:MarR family transcriptional regulator n=1 Tax=Sulfurimonas marina TaxID=2590551 RepID=A0A7M1AUN6_9BACT|nr:MarR family transcriptional regulator [Sulfurimonas marina]QOP41130.1 MarR family transcriptional regulator [Sulfurimonas marina]